MVNIQVLDSKVLNRLTYKRFTGYLGLHGWTKHEDIGEIETWVLGDKQVTVMPSIHFPDYLPTMQKNLDVLADTSNQPQIFVVAAMLGDVKVSVEDNEVIHWREWHVSNDDAEMKVVLYKNVGITPYEDGDKLIQGTQMDMGLAF